MDSGESNVKIEKNGREAQKRIKPTVGSNASEKRL